MDPMAWETYNCCRLNKGLNQSCILLEYKVLSVGILNKRTSTSGSGCHRIFSKIRGEKMSTARNPKAAVIFFCCLTISLASTQLANSGPTNFGVEGYRFILPDIEAEIGDQVTLTLMGEHEESAQGFVMAASYPSESISIENVRITEKSILDAIEIDYFVPTISAEEGYFIISVLVDLTPPFEGNLIPNVSFGLNFLDIDIEILPDSDRHLEIKLQDGLSTPPISNSYTVNNESISVTEHIGGAITVLDAASDGIFVRGDSTMNYSIDIADPILTLQHIFLGGRPPACALSADANDDESLNIADPVFTLDFLFNGGRDPAPPYHSPGLDPTPGRLDCIISL